ncbi:MAG: hypothetical protein FJ100_05840 [Deltaproteobacteria bacterium]|nr:hypothetical protein [Deltaproteobacteria bacterium]
MESNRIVIERFALAALSSVLATACVGGGSSGVGGGSSRVGGGSSGGGFFVPDGDQGDLVLRIGDGDGVAAAADGALQPESDGATGVDGGDPGDAGSVGDGGGDSGSTADASPADAKDTAGGCAKAIDCDDADPCTADSCNSGKCAHAPVASCGKQPPPCDAKNACPAGAGVCDPETNACVPCLVSKDCGAGKVCAAKQCVAALPCKSDVDCKASGKVCNKTAGACVECNQAGDCGADHTCINNQCYPAPPCTTSKECNKVCDFQQGLCVDCLSAEDCPAGQTCTPAKLCKPALCSANACGAGQSFFVCKPGGGGYLKGVSCDDGNACTVNSCAPDKGCSTKFNAANCDDGDKCTEGDTCSIGQCVGAKKECDDGNACTNDSCSPKLGCVTGPAFGACEDGDLCTTGDYCENEKCTGTPKVCEDGDVCTKDTCDPKAGCAKDAAEGPCDDKNVCTSNDKCVSGVCLGEAKGCDDNNPCTDDKCNAVGGGCTNTNNLAACEDGNACTTNDKCSIGKCLGGATKTCDDANPCTTDSCTNGACQNLNNTAACNDGDPCTLGDACNGGACKTGPTPMTCNDNNTCTDDKCEKAAGGCQYLANTADCTDSNVCTETDKCANKVCTGSTPKTCDDNDACTQNTCDKVAGCKYPADLAKCDDKDLCTTDSCGSPGGTCAHQKVPNCCTKQAQCDDADPCTDDVCAGNQCVHKQNGKCCTEVVECNDNSLCTADSCLLGKCQFTALPDTPKAEVLGDFDDLGDMQGWVFNPTTNPVTWSQSSTAGANTGAGALLYGDPGKLKLNAGSVTGYVLSPKFTVPTGGTTTLTLQYKVDYVGSSLVPLYVYIVAAGKETQVANGVYNTLKKYQPLTVDLSPWGGQAAQIKLTAQIGYNAASPGSGYGLVIDDVQHTWSCKAKACTTDSNCNTPAACATGQCVAGACTYSSKCCTLASECNDNNACTTDQCSGGKCVFNKVANCCAKDGDCNDSNTCTYDTCNVAAKTCKFSGVAECCTSSAQCNDNDACTIDSCNAGTCNFQNTCCAADKDCDDKDDTCTIDKCNATTKKCEYTGTGVAGCCLPTVWKETFDGPLTGWTISNSGGPGKGWQQWGTPKNPPGPKSPPGVLYYGDPALQNFNFGSNSGTIKSPKVVLPAAATKLTLKSALYMDTEGGLAGSFDDLYIYAVVDGVQQPLAVWNKSALGFTTGQWLSITGDLTAYKGKTLELVFSFNTKDSIANAGLGVLLDDLTVERACP